MWSAALFVARIALGSIFLITGVSKLSSPTSVVDGIMNYRLLSRRQAQLVAPLLPVVELLLATLLIAGVGLTIAASVASLLLATFTAAIVINLRRGRQFSCNCFGSSHATIGPAMVLRNGALISLSLFIAAQARSLLSIGATATEWRVDTRIIFDLNLLAPLVAAVLLSLGILLLLNEANVLFSTPSPSKEMW